MKISSMFCASIVSVAVAALAANAAFAATTIKGSHSNSSSYKSINAKDASAVAACTKGGGKVGKDDKGQDACITPAPEGKK